MANNENYPKIAQGIWLWGTDAAGGDQVFGKNLPARGEISDKKKYWGNNPCPTLQYSVSSQTPIIKSDNNENGI